MRPKYRDVREFHNAFGFPVKEIPDTLMNATDVHLRKSLIREENRETQESLEAADRVGTAHELADLHYIVAGTAVSLGLNPDDHSSRVASTMLHEGTQRLLSALEDSDHAEAARAVLRTEITIYGIAAVLGIPHDRVWAEVHRANMDKMWSDGPHVEHVGDIIQKVLKPPGWRKPDIKAVLDQATTIVETVAPLIVALLIYLISNTTIPAEAFY